MNKSLREWFVFTKKERTGVVLLVIIILALSIIPYFFSVTFEYPGNALTKQIQQDLLLVHRTTDSSAITPSMALYDSPAEKKPATLFEFDPNTLPGDGWRKLGLRERAIQIIQKYLSRGGRFYQAADLKKIYGISEADALRLIPFVRIKQPQRSFEKTPYQKFKKKEPVAFDINTADTSAFMALPGIGSKLANRTIAFRNKLGGFYSVEQVKETYGLSDSVYQQVKSLLQCTGSMQTININTADFNTLSRHPYIGRNLANAIIRYREQHGQKIVLITAENFQKIVHYVAVE